MSPSREDYLKVVYYKNLLNEKLTNKQLAAKLEVSQAATSEMLNKLLNSKKIIKDPNFGYKLTTEGETEIRELIKKHRLWEVFLSQHLGYSWDEVHSDAEILEHCTSDLLAERLNTFLGNPQHCPHGGVIFGNGLEDENDFIILSELPTNTKATITQVSDDDSFMHYIIAKGLHLGDTVKILQIDPFDSSLILLVNSEEITISYKAAKQIFVKSTCS